MAELTQLKPLAERAWVYGYPLVVNLDHVRDFVRNGLGSVAAMPFNALAHGRQPATAAERFVSINNDTVYSIAQLDLGVGPLMLRVPDTGGAYYVFQFVDAWTNNFAYVGSRATGTAARTFLLVPPWWHGPVPEGVTQIRFPTRVATMVGRWALRGAADLPRVADLQAATSLTPYGRGAPAAAGLPNVDAGVPDSLLFWEKLRVWMAEFPPAPRDRGRQASFEPLGLLERRSPYLDDTTERAAVLIAAAKTAEEQVRDTLRHGADTEQNGWRLTRHTFDYNADFFEVGTIDADAWKIADRDAALDGRAAAAMGGLWGNHAYEAAYAFTYVDDHGHQLTGDRTYTLTLDPPPPVRAFWSVTMYDSPDFFLVDNPIGRYSVGDRTPGLVTAADGAVTITMSATPPADPVAMANWLPAPKGDFRPILRMYVPGPDILDGGYVLPPVVRVAR